MRIVHVIGSIAGASSGTTRSVTRLCEELRSRGHDVTLACLDAPGHVGTPDWVRRFPASRLSGRLGVSPSLHAWLMGLHSPGGVGKETIIHSHSLWRMANVYAAWAARRSGIPLVASPHGTLAPAAFACGSPLKRVAWPWLFRPALSGAMYFHATSSSEAQHIRDRGLSQPVSVIPLGIDVPPPDTGNAVRAREVLFVGRVHPIKGVDVLLRAWGRIQLRHPDWRLRIVGPDDRGYLGTLRALAGKLGLLRVAFEGELRAEDCRKAYTQASIFVLPSKSENFGLVVAEALAHGLPVIVSKGTPWSAVEEKRCGWWCDGNEEAIAGALDEGMSMDSAARVEMGGRGRAWMAMDCSWKSVAMCVESVYAMILRSRSDESQSTTAGALHSRL